MSTRKYFINNLLKKSKNEKQHYENGEAVKTLQNHFILYKKLYTTMKSYFKEDRLYNILQNLEPGFWDLKKYFFSKKWKNTFNILIF